MTTNTNSILKIHRRNYRQSTTKNGRLQFVMYSSTKKITVQINSTFIRKVYQLYLVDLLTKVFIASSLPFHKQVEHFDTINKNNNYLAWQNSYSFLVYTYFGTLCFPYLSTVNKCMISKYTEALSSILYHIKQCPRLLVVSVTFFDYVLIRSFYYSDHTFL